jgi:RimJ/RimL family protein N-acetyltransferase
VERNSGRQVIERLRRIIEKNEQKLAYFQNRLKQAQFIDRPNQRMIHTAGVQAELYADQLNTLYNQLRELERLYSGGVKLRTTEEHDLRRIWYWANEPALCQALRTEPVSLQAYIDNWHRWMADEDSYPLSIDSGAGELIGFILIRCTGRAWETRYASLELIVIRPDCRYRGYGAEAMKRAIDFAFETLGAATFKTQVDADNYPAFLCFERSGLQCVDRENNSGAERYAMELSREAWQDQRLQETASISHSKFDANTASNNYAVTLFAPLKDLISNR